MVGEKSLINDYAVKVS